MNVAELKSILERLEEIYAAGGATVSAKDLRSVTELLDGYEDKTIDAFIADTQRLLEPTRAVASSHIDAELVQKHAEALLSAGTDQRKFEQALQVAVADRGLNKFEWIAIANAFRNAPSGGTFDYKFKSVKDAKAAIRDTFIERFEAKSKLGIIERITKWAS